MNKVLRQISHNIKKEVVMKRKIILALVAILVGAFYLTGFALAAEEQASEKTTVNKIVVVKNLEEPRPATLTAPPGTTVIWVNHSRNPQEILFLDKKVVLACGAPVNFFVGHDGAYESAKIPFGGTASLCFTEKGKYEYKVKSSQTFYAGAVHPGLKKEFKCIIWIQ